MGTVFSGSKEPENTVPIGLHTHLMKQIFLDIIELV